jgi:Domain of unknown function (DUF4145)
MKQFEEKITIKRQPNKNKIVSVPCHICGNSTRHNIKYSFLSITSIESSIIDLALYGIVQCRGCRRLSFLLESLDIDVYYDDQIASYKSIVFPNRVLGKTMLKWRVYVPKSVRSIYEETYRALGNEQLILAGIGLRALVEAVCKEKKVKGKNLKEKIDDLVIKSILTKTGADVLQSIRHIGNYSAHEVEANSLEELLMALDVVEHVLNEVYIIPARSKALPTKKKKRSC